MFDMNLLFAIPGLIVSFAAYGYAQARTAEYLGDPTPRLEGRLTLNPIPHIEPWGLLAICFIGFGWGRSVPINLRNFADPGKGLMLVSVAGLAANIAAAFVSMALLFLLLKLGYLPNWLFLMLQMASWFNVMFAVLNLIPIPPLDGSRIVAYFLPPRLAYQYESYGAYGMILLIVLIYFLNFGAVLRPIIRGILGVMQTVLSLVF